MTPYLQISGLTKCYGANHALDGIELSVETGDVLALLGPNGAGKSTLFGCLLGFTRPAQGELRLNGSAITAAERLNFGYVAERVAVYPQRTVRENAQFFAELKGYSDSEVQRQLTRVGLCSVQERLARALSKGMLQRLGLAIALCGRPELLVLDEPFNGLDPALLETLQEIMREENERGATLLISTHTMSAVEPLATHVAILLQGRLASSGTLAQLKAEHPAADSLEDIYHRIARAKHSAEVLV
ncbi:MAG TPA: ABC transporter ATP-binding protein [Verrucomicrobiae bacterium]|nr:ABC transporter ATP-binding protein [Verrucomicrobiae bacterium]